MRFSEELWEKVEYNRFGLMCVSITFQSCLGGVAVCFLLQLEQMYASTFLTLVTSVTMLSNSMAIAQLPMRWVVKMFFSAVFTTLIIMFLTYILI